MTLYLFLLVSILVHVSFQHFLIPRLEAKKAGGQKTFKKSAAIAVLKYVSTTSLLAAATYALIVVVILLLGLTRPVTAAEFGAAIANIQALQSKFKFFRELWTLWLFLILLLAYVAYRNGRKAAAPAPAVEEPLPPLPPNEEMKEILREIEEREQRVRRLEQSWVRSDDELAARKTELGREADALRARLREADARRRARPEPASASEHDGRARRFFASKGFLKTLEGTTRSLGYVGTVLLVLCVLGVNVPVLQRALANRAIHLSELQVEASKDEALRSFNRVMAEEEAAPKQLSEEDRRAVEEAARLFEQAFTSSKELRQEDEDKDDDDRTHVVFVTRSHVARDQIVADFRRDPPPRGPNPPPPGGGGGGGGGNDGGGGGGGAPERPRPPAPAPGGQTDDLRSLFVSDERGPRTRLGRDFAATLEKEVAVRPRLLEKLKAKLSAYKASFNEPFEPLDLGKFAFGEAVGYAVDKSWDAPNEVAGQLKKVGQTAIKDTAKGVFARVAGGGKASPVAAVRRMYEARKWWFVADVAGDASFGDAVEHVQEGLPERPVLTAEEVASLREVAAELPRQEPVVKGLTDSYQKSPPALPYSEAELAENEAEAARLRRALAGRAGRELSSEELKSVDSYEDHYPGRAGSAAETPRAKLLTAAGRTPNASTSETLLAQSRDFSSLSKSVDVGGILMGRSPEPSGARLDFRDLRWSAGEEGLTLALRDAAGAEVSVGPFEKSLVHQALAYAADDRKVVVTIYTGGEGKRRVMLHPALADTRLGGDIIEFDKLVFKFMNRCDPACERSDKLIEGQLALYNVAHGLRILSVLREWSSDGGLTAAGRAQLRADSAWERRVFGDSEVYELLKPALLDAEALDRPEKSPIAFGKAYFDQTLVRDIKRCATQSRDHLPVLHQCLSETFAANARFTTEETHKVWLEPPPELAWRSIAEELPYRTDARLSFLREAGAAAPAERLWPFQFRYELAFPFEAPFKNAADTSDAYRAPWEFAELRGLIAEKVWGGVEADAELRALYKRVRDFTVLQRLFRASLEGGLGQRFPVEKLVLLTRATAGSLAAVQTPRWDDPKPQKCD
jgi:hypothetical protein